VRHQEESTARQQQAGTAPRRDGARLLERKTTLAAIAAEAGVSLPTVSKVVNGRPDVAPATRARVEQLLDQHQYSRNGLRRNRRSGLIDVVFAGLDSPWAVEILRGIEEWGAQHETAVAVSSVRHGNARPASWTSALASHHTDGVILVLTRPTETQLGQLRSAGIPLVVIDPANTPPPDIPSVGATNWAGGLAATDHLLGLGHRRIGAITGPIDMLCSLARLDGYGAAASGGTALAQSDVDRGGMLVLGSETHGLSRSDLKLVTIPLRGGVESLNVAAAAAVILFEIRRRLAA